MTIRRSLALIALAGLMSISASAQKVDFTGTWELNVPKSSMGGEHPFDAYSLTKVIEQSGEQIKQTEVSVRPNFVGITLPDSKVVREYIPDGKERKVTEPSLFPGRAAVESMVAAEWQGGTLLVTERSVGARGPSKTQRRYFLSADGSQLIELIISNSTFSDSEQRLVFDKQP